MIAAAAVLFSCTPEKSTAPGMVSVDPATAVLGALAGSMQLSVKAEGAWTASVTCEGSSKSWASLDKASGNGDATLTVTWSATDVPVQRFCLVTVASGERRAYADLVQETPGGLFPSDPLKRWMELPAVNADDDTYFEYHNMTVGGREIRNFSYLFDASAHVARWVAYPLNSSLAGKGSRTDAWGLDPKVPSKYQAVIYSGFKGGYQRGHQLPSADRLSYNANVTTFYGTNMTPQKGELNENAWATLESYVRTWSSSFDTLYVVTGADIRGSTSYATDNDGKKVAVPVGYYKALLGYKKKGTIGITASTGGYSGIGFYMEHRAYNDADILTPKCMMTIDELENKLGMDFFVLLPRIITPTYADKVESSTDPWWSSKVQ